MDFDDILRKQEKTREAAADQSHAPKRQKRLDEIPFSEAIGSSLFEIWKEVKSDAAGPKTIDILKLEVEVRVGHIVAEYLRWKPQCSRKQICTLSDTQRAAQRLTFKSGVDEIFAEHVKRVLSAEGFKVEDKPLQRLRATDNGPRWEVDNKGRVLMVESKVKVFRCDLGLLSHQYDVRINAATELPAEKSSVTQPDKWTVERLKRRKTFTSSRFQWKIDLTEVDSTERTNTSSSGLPGSSPSIKEVELEFELDPEPMRRWLNEKDEGAAVQATKMLGCQLEALINLCIPGETENVGEAPMEPLTTPKAVQEIIRINEILKAASQYRGAGGLEFLGCMPINLSRRNLLNVQRNNYFLAEKSDGTRYLLYVIETIGSNGSKESTAVLFNRAKVITLLHGANIIGASLGVGTVLDGELVYNLSLNETVFLVFDVLAVEGRACLQLPFSERTNIIKSDIMSRYAKHLSHPSNQSSSTKATKLIRKNFVLKNQLESELLRKISLVNGERVYRDTDRRHHKSDGIIFQPDSPYTFSIDSDLLKWKWSEVRSVDLQVVVSQGSASSASSSGGRGTGARVQLMCGGPDGSVIDCSKRGRDHVGLGAFDTFRLLADMQERGGASRIAEVVYDASIGLWGYLHLRKDKTEPNFIDTVVGVFMEQAEGISVEELTYRMRMKADSADDWNAQVSKMKGKLLDFQAQQLAGGGAQPKSSSKR